MSKETLPRWTAAAAACLLVVLTSAPAQARPPIHLDVQLNVASALVDLSPTHGATADAPAEPGGDSSPEALRTTLKRLEMRRNMLVAHQVLAWTALSSLFAAQVVGMTNRVSLQTGSPQRSTLEPSLGVHRALAATAIGTYYGAGMMAWMSPGPGGTRSVGDKGFSQYKTSRDVHIALSIGHNIAMALTIVTGVLQANAFASKNWDGLIVAHTLSAVTTVGLMIPAAAVISRF